MALGAGTSHIRWLMLASGLKLTVAGLVCGVLAAIACARLIGGMLFGVQPYDPGTYAAVITALATLSLLATYLPTRRALRVDPVVVLRQE
jgi:ABC-type lipoprotein release transport system permease subunit